MPLSNIFLKVTPDRPRKVASRNIPDVSGAIVLPSRMASAANGFRIPRSAVPHLRQTTPTEQQSHADEGKSVFLKFFCGNMLLFFLRRV